MTLSDKDLAVDVKKCISEFIVSMTTYAFILYLHTHLGLALKMESWRKLCYGLQTSLNLYPCLDVRVLKSTYWVYSQG